MLSYMEYHLVLVGLCGAILFGLGALEFIMRKYQILPLMFNGMFLVRQRRLYCFGTDITTGSEGKRIRGNAKMMVRVNTIIVSLYLWESLVLQTSAVQGMTRATLDLNCANFSSCFVSEVNFNTVFSRHADPIDCQAKDTFADFLDRNDRVVICFKGVTPSSYNILLHCALAHSIGVMFSKAFEVMVWVANSSLRVQRLLVLANVIYTVSALVTFLYSGQNAIGSTYLSFVLIISMTVFLVITRNAAIALRKQRSV
jgi:hypothetical protein